MEVLVDAQAYRDLAPSWSPGIVVIAADGTVIEAVPGGDLRPLQAALDSPHPRPPPGVPVNYDHRTRPARFSHRAPGRPPRAW